VSRRRVPGAPRLADVPAASVQLAVVGVVLFVLVLSSPLLGAVDLTPPSDDRVGDGTANVTLASDPAGDLRIDRGRFGTRVFYLRPPAVTADVRAVTGRPRLVYLVRVPNLSFERTATTVVDSPGRHTLRMRPRAYALSTVNRRRYRADVVVRVQGLGTDRVVARRSVSITVRNRTTWGGA